MEAIKALVLSSKDLQRDIVESGRVSSSFWKDLLEEFKLFYSKIEGNILLKTQKEEKNVTNLLQNLQ